jgi:hypothetical protein
MERLHRKALTGLRHGHETCDVLLQLSRSGGAGRWQGRAEQGAAAVVPVWAHACITGASLLPSSLPSAENTDH